MIDTNGCYMTYPDAPGSPDSPCPEGTCHHISCLIAHSGAKRVCKHCQQPIGYGNLVWMPYSYGGGVPEHEACHDQAFEKQEEEEVRRKEALKAALTALRSEGANV